MKRSTLFGLLILGTLLATPQAGHAKLKVVATLTDIGWIAEQVGGDDVEVSVLCPGHQDPHYLPAKPSLAKKLRRADLLLYNGLELEVGWLPLLIDSARNPKVKPGSRGELECALAINHVLDIPTGHVDRSGGDIHPLGNPHYLFDPHSGIEIGHLIAERMAELDPDAAARYLERAAFLEKTIHERVALWKESASILKGYPIIVYHQHWEYLLHWLGIKNIGSIEHRPGISPSPRHVEKIIRLGRSQERVFVIAAKWDNLKIAEKAAERMDVPLAILPGAVGGIEGVDTYLDLFESIVKSLTEAAEAGIRNGESRESL